MSWGGGAGISCLDDPSLGEAGARQQVGRQGGAVPMGPESKLTEPVAGEQVLRQGHKTFEGMRVGGGEAQGSGFATSRGGAEGRSLYAVPLGQGQMGTMSTFHWGLMDTALDTPRRGGHSRTLVTP